MAERKLTERQKVFELYDPLRNHKTGPSLIKAGGTWVFPAFPSLWPKIREIDIRQDDVFVASFPKTGTNWLNYIIYMIHTGNIGEVANADYAPKLLEMPVPMNLYDIWPTEPSPRRMLTHLPAHLLPVDEIFEKKAHLIYIYRDVKDVAVSMYHHYLAFQPNKSSEYNDTFDNFARHFITGEVQNGPYELNLKSFYDLKKTGKPILFLSFEDLKKETKKTIRQIAEFLGKELSDEIIERIEDASMFHKMRASTNPSINMTFMQKMGAYSPSRDFLRKGIVGDWQNHFTDKHLLADFDQYVRDNYPLELFPDYEQNVSINNQHQA